MASGERRLDIVIAAQSRTAAAYSAELSRVRAFAGGMRALALSIGGAFAAVGLGAFLRESLKAFGEQEKASAELATSLAFLGERASATQAGVEMMATTLQRSTTVADEATIGLAAYIARVGELSGRPLEEATKAALGLSRALGIDATMAARQYLRALQGTFTTLGRSIPLLQQAKTDAERLAIVNELAAKGLVQLATDAQTSEGRLTQLHNAINDVQETIGEALAPVVIQLANVFLNNADHFKHWGETLKFQVVSAIAVFENFGDVLDNVLAGANLALQSWADVVDNTFANLFGRIEQGFRNIEQLARNLDPGRSLLQAPANFMMKLLTRAASGTLSAGFEAFTPQPLTESGATQSARQAAENARARLERMLQNTIEELLGPGPAPGLPEGIDFHALSGLSNDKAKKIRGLSSLGGRGGGDTVLSRQFLGLSDQFADAQQRELAAIRVAAERTAAIEKQNNEYLKELSAWALRNRTDPDGGGIELPD